MTDEYGHGSAEERDPEAQAAESESAEQTPDEQLEERLAVPIMKGVDEAGSEAANRRAQIGLSAFLLAVAGLIAFSNAFRIPFHYEDTRQIVQNDPLHHPVTFVDGLEKFTDGGAVAAFSLSLNWWLAPENATAFHAVNIVIHILSGIILFLLCRQLFRGRAKEPVAMLAGLLLVLHPANTEAVNYVIGRSASLGAGLSMLSVLLFLRAVRDAKRVRAGMLAASFAAFGLAWASNHAAAALIPFLAAASDWVVHGGKRVARRASFHGAYWGLLGLLAVAGRYGVERLPSETPLRFGAMGAALMRYIMLTLSPAGLSVFHGLDPEAPASGGIGLLLFAVLAVVALALLARRSVLGLGLAWYLAALAPAAWAFASAGEFSERAVYLPVAGLALLLPWLLTDGIGEDRTRVMLGIASAVVVLAAGGATFMRNQVWQDELTLWSDAADKNLQSSEPRKRLGLLFEEYGRKALAQAGKYAAEDAAEGAAQQREAAQQFLAKSEEYLREAMRWGAEDAETLAALGTALSDLGQRDKAVELLKEALAVDPSRGAAAARIAAVLHANAMTSGNREDLLAALDYYAYARKRKSLSPELQAQYATAYLSLGNVAEAARVLEDLGELSGDSPLQARRTELRRAAVGIRELEQRAQALVRDEPGSAEGLVLTAQALTAKGQVLRASYILSRVLKAHEDRMDAWRMLGAVKSRMGQAESFLEEWGGYPAQAEAPANEWLMLVQGCAGSGQWNTAAAYLTSEKAAEAGVEFPLRHLADMAEKMRQPQIAAQFLERATQAYPEAAWPWLRLFDRAVAAKNYPVARRLLGEAEKRGAAAEELAPRREKLDAEAPAGSEDVPSAVMR